MDFKKTLILLHIVAPFFFLLAAILAILYMLGAGPVVVESVWVLSALGGALSAVGLYLLATLSRIPFKDYAAGGVIFFLSTFISCPVGMWLASTLFTAPLWIFVAPCALTGALSFGLLWLAEKNKLCKLFPPRR